MTALLCEARPQLGPPRNKQLRHLAEYGAIALKNSAVVRRPCCAANRSRAGANELRSDRRAEV